ncbi:hypothetical protein LUZ60_004470 [Juncus effusus]|nr:hypothetical protein LUZ60_004470 [Juncus effusus]
MNLSPPSNNLSMASSYHHQETGSGTGTAPPHLSLSRYDSAPGSFLSTPVSSSSAAPAAPPAGVLFGRYFPGESSSSSPSLTLDSTTCKVGPDDQRLNYGSGNQAGVDPNPLVRHRSSPAGFFSNLLMDNSNYAGRTDGIHAPTTTNNRQLKSQLSFTKTLSQISEDEIPDFRESIGDENRSSGFSIGSWEDTNSIVFTAQGGKRGKGNEGDVITGLGNIDSQFGLQRASSMEMLHMQQDQVPFKVRAKRGCATHPRSIAERERRTRISEKLRKLQDLVPNMDKQTSTSDMLDLAVQHIRGLQSQIQILAKEQENCTCGNKRSHET